MVDRPATTGVHGPVVMGSCCRVHKNISSSNDPDLKNGRSGTGDSGEGSSDSE